MEHAYQQKIDLKGKHILEGQFQKVKVKHM